MRNGRALYMLQLSATKKRKYTKPKEFPLNKDINLR